MGMDGVEIVLRIEEAFAIEISANEAAAVRTVGALYELVLSKLETAPSLRPARAFFRLRRAIGSCLGRPRSTIGPTTKLAHLLPRPTRVAAWRSLAEVTGLAFPPLRHPRWVRDTIRVLTGAAGLATLMALIAWSRPDGLFWIPVLVTACFAGALAMAGLYRVTGFLAWELPMRTVGELAAQLTGLNRDEFGEAGELLSRQDVWQRLVAIFCEQLGLRWEEIQPEARIVENLGVEWP